MGFTPYDWNENIQHRVDYVETRLREGGDTGEPVVIAAPDSEAAQAFAHLAKGVAAQGPARVYRQELRLL